MQSLPDTVFQHLLLFVPDLGCMQQLSQTCRSVRANCLHPHVRKHWLETFLAKLPNERMRNSVKHLLPMLQMPYSRMAGGLSRSRCEWCRQNYVTDLSFPLGVAICTTCANIHVRVPTFDIHQFLSGNGLPNVTAGAPDIFTHPHWPMVPKEACLDNYLRTKHGLAVEYLDVVRNLISYLQDEVVFDLRLDSWGSVPDSAPFWPIVRSVRFDVGVSESLRHQVVSSMRASPANQLASKHRMFGRLLAGSDIPTRQFRLAELLIPVHTFCPLAHTVTFVKAAIKRFDAERTTFLNRQKKIPTAYRRLQRRNRYPPSSSWSIELERIVPNAIKPCVRTYFANPSMTWMGATKQASSQISNGIRPLGPRRFDVAVSPASAWQTSCLKRVCPLLAPQTLHLLACDLNNMLTKEQLDIIHDDDLRAVVLTVMPQRYRQYVDWRRVQGFDDDDLPERWSSDGEPLEIWTFLDTDKDPDPVPFEPAAKRKCLGV